MYRWPDIYSMKVKDKNFGIETATETVLFRMVSVTIDLSNDQLLIMLQRDRPSAKYLLRMMIEQHTFYHPPQKNKKSNGLG